MVYFSWSYHNGGGCSLTLRETVSFAPSMRGGDAGVSYAYGTYCNPYIACSRCAVHTSTKKEITAQLPT